ncbi:MAG: hypothetical protein MUC51_05745 [Anaerolineae bacterium]|nr:hypothetical protein [Anaerolineae bacterium]
MNPSETYNPSFLIKIKGTELRHAATVDVLSVSVTDVADGPDSFAFTVRDRNPTPGAFAGGQLRWLDDGLFDEGNEVEISIGYVDNLQFMLRGDITACTPSFPESGVPTRHRRRDRQRRQKGRHRHQGLSRRQPWHRAQMGGAAGGRKLRQYPAPARRAHWL